MRAEEKSEIVPSENNYLRCDYDKERSDLNFQARSFTTQSSASTARIFGYRKLTNNPVSCTLPFGGNVTL
jgi:hypothetical protein